EFGQGLGQVGAVAEFAEEPDALPIAGNGVIEPAQVPVGVAEAVPGAALAVAVIDLPVQGERLPMAGQRPLVLAEDVEIAGRVVDRVCLPGRMPGGPVTLQRLLRLAQGLAWAGWAAAHMTGRSAMNQARATPLVPGCSGCTPSPGGGSVSRS